MLVNRSDSSFRWIRALSLRVVSGRPLRNQQAKSRRRRVVYRLVSTRVQRGIRVRRRRVVPFQVRSVSFVARLLSFRCYRETVVATPSEGIKWL